MNALWRRAPTRPFYKTLIDAAVFAVVLLLVSVVAERLGLFAPETGHFAAIDGDSLRRGAQEYRLYGIDAPELHQTCSGKTGHEYACGELAEKELAGLIANADLSCFTRDTDRYGRTVALCKAGDTDINAAMVSRGWAVAYRRHSVDYVGEEAEARRTQRGIWQGSFERPEDWRNDHRTGLLEGAADD